MVLGANIKIIREKWKLSQGEFGALVGATRGMIMQYEKRGSVPKSNIMQAIVTVTGLSAHILELKPLETSEIPSLSKDLMEKIDDMRENPDDYTVKQVDETVSKKTSSNLLKLNGVPYYDVDATAGNVTIFEGETQELIKDYINIPWFRSCKAFINVKGHSMYPKYQAGDVIGIIPVEDKELIQYGESYLIVSLDNQRMVKTIRKHKEKADYVILHNENDKFDDFDLPIRKILKLYLIKGLIRDGVMG